jgi:hypothetical protein
VGELPTDVQAQVSALPLAKLERLNEVLLDFGEMEDLVQWLRENEE